LYRETGEKKYLDCAELIVDRRGEKPKKQALFTMTQGIGGTDLIQDRVPVRDSSEIVGHNVFFTYLYTGAGDVYAESGDEKLEAALERLWTDMTEQKMFIHGGVSARPAGISNMAPVIEAAGADYELPNAGCYNETCGQIGCFMWGYRMLNNHPDARFADIMEREMYNGFLGGEALDGEHWFYRNIIRRYDENYQSKGGNDMALRGQPGRKEICCPSNLLRTLAEMSAYFYSTDATGLWVHQYGGSKVDTQLAGGDRFAFEQMTDYPWDGTVKLVISQAPAQPVALRLRVPGWADASQVRLNGKPLTDFKVEHGYVAITQIWRPGDAITLNLPMAPQLVVANPLVEEARNQVAVMRGPVLYCAESPDLPAGTTVPQVYVSSQIDFQPVAGLGRVPGKLAETAVLLRGTGLRLVEPQWKTLYRPRGAAKFESFELTLIPYYAWANRGKSTMSVWLPVVLDNKS
ncbi:MAG: Conserved hypothetical periplasmic protein, partial [Lacunisphaera sp.]|nr:Conserved hypothetical periplasmic protein [Lacunisphaera sp.]